MMDRREHGVVLFSALIFLLVITLLVIGVAKSGLLEAKINNNYYAKVMVLQKAEVLLRQQEKTLATANYLPPHVVVLTTQTCGVIFYRVNVEAGYLHARVTLQSVYAKLLRHRYCKTKPTIRPGRQSWLEL
ncbi:MAG: hypothetical protein KAS93_03595 [Gammaproteobacteria bacterium]|nr:hypothetical protein [Gammaproteobacteria bacterium]